MLSESITMYGIQIWGLDGGLEDTDKYHSRFYKIILGVSRFTANSMAGVRQG
jgi:hypothetical protein